MHPDLSDGANASEGLFRRSHLKFGPRLTIDLVDDDFVFEAGGATTAGSSLGTVILLINVNKNTTMVYQDLL